MIKNFMDDDLSKLSKAEMIFIILFILIIIAVVFIVKTNIHESYKTGQIDFQKGIVLYKIEDDGTVWEIENNPSQYGIGQLDAQNGKINWKIEDGKIWKKMGQ